MSKMITGSHDPVTAEGKGVARDTDGPLAAGDTISRKHEPSAAPSWTGEGQSQPHICNCIGCCEKCGQCRTNPTHARTCDEIARLNTEREEILERARHDVVRYARTREVRK